ncbi:DUF5677 domain-containing protein [Cytobacillus oceanisediminis]|uniref:Uncharacterized protein n=1 Tax=Cytobacillus oceanisediminis TaxID=665099 RepID=A0ABX3CJ40_9BACI|nr:DUF5677 domain-containing protein [Cytobacillus oceanisediminis]OHX38842.1 hypothetical protein BBV17_04865 [Cytobacillus oceanisediminis]
MKALKRVVKESEKVFNNVIEGYSKLKGSEMKLDYHDIVILGLLENLINQSKSMILLLENNQHSSLDTILRVIFENYVYIKFILEKDTPLRAKSYTYSTKIKEIELLNYLTEDSLDGYKLRNFLDLKKDEVKKVLTADKMDDKYQKSIRDGYLSEIGMKRTEQKWYNLDGKTKNFKALCLKIDLFVEYNLIYSILSIETHGKDALRNFRIEEDRIDLINMVKSKELYLSMSEMCLMESVKLIYENYGLKGPLKSFNTLVAINYNK